MKSTEASINDLLNLSKGIICHVFTKCPEKQPSYTCTPTASGLFEVRLAIPGTAFPIDKQRARHFTSCATQKQVAEKWAALFGCLELKKEGVFPDYAAQFLHILNGTDEAAVVPFYNDMCQANLQKSQPNAPQQREKRQKQTTNTPSTDTQSTTNQTRPLQSPLPPPQLQPQKPEDHQILRKSKKKPIYDTPNEVFDQIRSKSDLDQLGQLDCVCRFCKTPLCLSSDLTVEVNSIWCHSKQITSQISELLACVSLMSSLDVPQMTSDQIDCLYTTKSAIEFSPNPMKTQRTLPYLVHCKHCHEHVGVLELSEVGGAGQLKLTRDSICFSVQELAKGKRVLIGAKAWKKLMSTANTNPVEMLSKKVWLVYNVKSNSREVMYPHLDNQFLCSYFIFCTKPLFSKHSEGTLTEGQTTIIREVDAHVQGGLSLVRKPAKSDQWQAFIVPEFIHSKQEHCHTMDSHGLELLIDNCQTLLKYGNSLQVLHATHSTDPQGPNAYFKGRIVRTPYNNRAYAISRINFNLTVTSPLPNSKTTFEEYYKRKGIHITDRTQPMIEIDMLSESMSSDKGFSTRSRNENDRYVHLVPELTELTGFTEELKEGAEIYKRLVPPAWKKLKFDRNLKKFEDKIGIKWENKELIAQAFDFTSQVHQRIEFLGDSVLDFVVSAYYFIKKPMANEVKLTFQRANKVSNLHLSKLALDMNLLKCMSGFQGGLSKLLANVFEAVIGAMFLDKGLYVASQFVCLHVLDDPHFCDTLFTKFVPPPHYGEYVRPSKEVVAHVATLESAIGYSFQNKALLYQAVTHPTMFNANYQHTMKDKTRKITKEEIHKKANLDYERFEFLGDMLIKFFLGVDFYFNKPTLNAGDLSFQRHIYVMNDYFAQLAHRLHMDEVIIKPDQYSLPPPTSSHSCLGDIFESITCAIYLDSGVVDPLWKGNDQSVGVTKNGGGGGAAARFIRTTLLMGMSREEEDSRMDMIKAKNALQAHFSKLGPNTVKYLELPKPTDCAFHVGAYVNDVMVGQGKGCNKQSAEKVAALDALRVCKQDVQK